MMVKKTTLRKFTGTGVDKFTELIDKYSAKKEPITKTFFSKLDSILEEYIQEIDSDIEIELLDNWESEPPTQYDLSKYLFDKIDHIFETHNLENDKGFWAYLSAFYMKILAPENTKLAKGHQYYIVDKFPKYRMRIRSWYLYYSIHKENSKHVIFRNTNVFGDFCEQIFSRVAARNSKLIIEILQRMKTNTDNGAAFKKGNFERHRNSLRYVMNEVSQYNTTMDIHSQNLDWVYQNLFLKNKSSKHLKLKSV